MVLLATFTMLPNLETTVDLIKKSYQLPNNCIFVLSLKDQEELICTYNVSDIEIKLQNTVALHRKKESNTLYTINALNALIKSKNNGILDIKYPINWTEYTNCLLVTSGSGYKSITTSIHSIIR